MTQLNKLAIPGTSGGTIASFWGHGIFSVMDRERDEMDGSYPSHLRLKDGSAASVVQDFFGPPGAGPDTHARILSEAAKPEEFAKQLFACESLTNPPKKGKQQESEPYTLQWFLNIENHRHGRHARWIPRLLEFAKHQGETLLGLGHGLGTDWLQYARNGASVIVCSSCTSQLDLIRCNFQLRGLEGRFIAASPCHLPLPKASIDVACISGLLQTVEDPQAVIAEVFRVLKPGGKVIAVTPAKYNVDFWRRVFFFWENWFRGKSATGDIPERQFSRNRLKRLFREFEIRRIYKRQLRRSDLPHLWRVWPLSLLERIMGRVLVLKAFKPISLAIQERAAA